MYQALVNEVKQLQEPYKAQLLETYRRLMSDEVIPIVECMSLQDAFPYAHSQNDELIALFGLDRRPTKHHLVINNITRYTWCIWDAFFIAHALNEKSQIITYDPISEAQLTASFSNHQWQVSEHYWVSFPKCNDANGELRNAFCRYVHLFYSSKSAEKYQQIQPCDVFPVSVLLDRTIQMAAAING